MFEFLDGLGIWGLLHCCDVSRHMVCVRWRDYCGVVTGCTWCCGSGDGLAVVRRWWRGFLGDGGFVLSAVFRAGLPLAWMRCGARVLDAALWWCVCTVSVYQKM